MTGIEEVAFSLITSLVTDALKSLVSFTALPFLQHSKIRRRVEIATLEVVEPLVPFLTNEGITVGQQELLFQVCTDELKPFVEQPEGLFSGSLDGQKIFDQVYTQGKLPQAIRDENLEDIYSLLFPRVATLLCRIPAAVKEWEANAWSESFKRLDDIAEELKQLFVRLDSVDERLSDSGRGVLAVARRALAQRVSMQVDLTGLRADTPVAGSMEDFFVHPALTCSDANLTVNTREESIAQFSQSSTLAIVYGDPGSGKSTWTRWLQKELLTSPWRGIAVRVELRQISLGRLPTLHDLVRQSVTIHLTEDLTAERIKEWITDGDLQFFLDGFDEVAPEHRTLIRDWIEELRTAIFPCPLIVTSRPLTTDHLENLPLNWKRWYIQPFDPTRVLDYITRWYAKMPLLVEGGDTPLPEQVDEELKGDPTIAPLTSNPLLLSTLLMVHHLDGRLPSGRAQLYRRYVDGMLGQWDTRRKVKASGVTLSQSDKKQILTAMALHLQLAEREEMDEHEAVQITQTCLQNIRQDYSPEEVLATLRERSGLLVGPGTYSFIHKSVSEFLVAEAAVQGSSTDSRGKRIDRFCLFEYRENDRWNVVTFLWAGLAPVADVESFIDQCSGEADIGLGYGIFLDQYERFSPSYRRQVVMRLISLNPRLESGGHYWIGAGIKYDLIDSPLRIPSAFLRGLSHPRLPKIFFHAVKDGLLLWSDAKGLRGNLRALIWMSIASYSENVQDWGRCIRRLPAGLVNHDTWMLWIAGIVIFKALRRKPHNEAQEYVRLFCQLHTSYSGLLGIALLDNVAAYSLDEEHLVYRNDFRRSVLDLAQQLSWDNIPPSVLAVTHAWSVRGSEELDLLLQGRKMLKGWKGEPALNSESIIHAVETVDSLIKKRPKPN